MKRLLLLSFGISLALVIVGFGVWLYSASQESAALRKERQAVKNLIFAGQDLSEAEAKLRDHGCKLLHDEAISPTLNQDYFQQLVIIGKPRPNIVDTAFYVVTGGKNPLRGESPYVMIKATRNKVISRIE